jgi:putative FmdB family regulatory protein
MPTYEYRCQTCEINFEIVQSFSEDTLAKCPTRKSGKSPAACVSPGRGKVSKVFSAPGITFKGDGFYKTDSREKSGAKSGSAPAKSSDNGSSKSSDSDSKKSETTKSSDSDSKKSDSKKSDSKKTESTSS